MKQTNIIEPCCIQNQLPRLMRSAKSGCFYSNGDWGAQKLLFATTLLVPGDTVSVLLMPSVDVYFCRYLHENYTRWPVGSICICTKEDCTELVKNELNDLKGRMMYVHRPNLSFGMYARFGKEGQMAICGPMALSNGNEFCQYHWMLNEQRWRFVEVVNPVVSIFALKRDGKYSKEIEAFLEHQF